MGITRIAGTLTSEKDLSQNFPSYSPQHITLMDNNGGIPTDLTFVHAKNHIKVT